MKRNRLAEALDTVSHALALSNILLARRRVPRKAIEDLKAACERTLDVGPELAAQLAKDASLKKKSNLN